MNASLFMRLSSQVTVGDLLTPLEPNVQADSSLAAADARVRRLGSGSGQFSLVLAGSNVVGWVDTYDLRPDAESAATHVRSIMQEVDLTRFVTAETPARRALRLVTDDPFNPWFVLDGHEFVGSLDYDCFFKPPFKVCLFAQTAELEQRSLWLCAQDAKASWASLPEKRRQHALAVMNDRRKHLPPSGLGEEIDEELLTDPASMLGYTEFCDKKTILHKRNLLPRIRKSEIKKVFEWMESIRNFCAHSGTYEEPFIQPKDLLRQMEACVLVLSAIEEQLLPPAPQES